MEKEKSPAELLKEKLFAAHKSAYEVCDEQEILKAYEYCGDYMKFLNDAKTERECVTEAVKKLDAARLYALRIRQEIRYRRQILPQ